MAKETRDIVVDAGGQEGVKMKADMDVEIGRCAALVVKYEPHKEKGFMELFYEGEEIWDC